jgi:hypothetical protein
MNRAVYYCRQENNTCPKREQCERFVNADKTENKTSLFKIACTEQNNFILFMKHQLEEETTDEQNTTA